VIHEAGATVARSIVGRVLAHGLSDEHADRHYLIVDGIDGRSHYLDVGGGRDCRSTSMSFHRIGGPHRSAQSGAAAIGQGDCRGRGSQ
jgi:hypothetical protein